MWKFDQRYKGDKCTIHHQVYLRHVTICVTLCSPCTRSVHSLVWNAQVLCTCSVHSLIWNVHSLYILTLGGEMNVMNVMKLMKLQLGLFCFFSFCLQFGKGRDESPFNAVCHFGLNKTWALHSVQLWLPFNALWLKMAPLSHSLSPPFTPIPYFCHSKYRYSTLTLLHL